MLETALAVAPTTPDPLARLEDAARLLAETRDLREILEIRDLAEAARLYARAIKRGLEAQNHAAEIKLRAERRAGELLAALPRERGFSHSSQPETNGTALQSTMREADISRAQSHRWQAVASLPEPMFEMHIADTRQREEEITSASMLRLAAEQQRATRVPAAAAPPLLSKPVRALLLVGDVRAGLAQLEPESVQTVPTSVPYWGLRSYGTEPQVWGGEPGHTHVWPTVPYVWSPGGNGERSVETSGLSSRSSAVRQAIKRPHAATMGDLCACGAWLGELGTEPTPELYVEHIVEVFRHVWRVLRKDGTVWLNIGFSYAGSGKGPTGWSGSGDQGRRQGFSGGGFQSWADRSLQQPGPGLTPVGYKPKDLVPIPWLVAMALQREGWYWRSIIAWAKKAPMPESVDDRPTSAWEPVLLLSKSRSYFYDAEAVAEPSSENTHSRGNGLNPKTIAPGLGIKQNTSFSAAVNEILPTRNMRNVWLLGPEPFPGAHFAVFPTEVPRRCILAGSRPGDLVLDPFSGAGTTSMVAARLGRDSVGIELKPEYAEMARDRIQADGGFTVDVELREVTQ